MLINPDQKKEIRHFGFSRKLYVFILCFIISSFFWCLIKLSKDYTEVQKFPVNYINIPQDNVLINDLDSFYTLKLKSNGFRILSNKLFFKPEHITIDVASLIREKKNSKKEYTIAVSDLYQTIGTQIHYPNNVMSVYPDTLYFSFEKLYSKKIPVRLRLNMSFAQQYKLKDSVRFDPDSVIVSGTKSAIDSIRYIETVSKTFTNLNADQALTLDFDPKYNLCKLKTSPSAIKIYVPVEKYTEATIELPVVITNNTNNYIVRTFPEKIKVTYLVSLENFKKVKPDMFSAVADISKAMAGKSKKMKVDISKSPEFIEIRSIEPEKVEFLLLK